MRVLVLGGSGFIGTHVVRELCRLGCEVAMFGRGTTTAGSHARRIIGDRRRLADFAGELRAFAPEVVIDIILSSGTQARAVMETFRGIARRVIALSSMDVYRACGVLHQIEPGPLEPLPLTEDSALRTKLQTYPPAQIKTLQQVFGWLDDEYDKIPVERVVLGDAELPGTVLRLPMVYGPGDRLHRFFPILKRIDDGRAAILFAQDLAEWRSPRGYVENVAAAIVLAAQSDRAAHRIYNVAERESFSELEWARLIANAAGWGGQFIVLPKDRIPPHLTAPGNLGQHWVVDTTRLREELGYEEPMARVEAMRRTIAWERANPPAQIDTRKFDYATEDAALL